MKHEELKAIIVDPATPTMMDKGCFQAFWNMKHCRGGVCIIDSGWYVIERPERADQPASRLVARWLVGATQPTTVEVPSGEVEARQLVATLARMHPELEWTLQTIGEMAYFAEKDAPGWTVAFAVPGRESEFGQLDPHSDTRGDACAISHWGLSEEAARLMLDHNKVFVAKYPQCDGPRMHGIEA